jgi:hypothetical protein
MRGRHSRPGERRGTRCPIEENIQQSRMIKRYTDHAANERTFLAWVRTAIATMAFGFLIERFDLFIRFAASKLDVSAESAQRAQLCRPGRVWVGRPRNGDDRGFRIAVLQDSETDRFGCR